MIAAAPHRPHGVDNPARGKAITRASTWHRRWDSHATCGIPPEVPAPPLVNCAVHASPPSSEVLAAFTMASTLCSVMSPSTISRFGVCIGMEYEPAARTAQPLTRRGENCGLNLLHSQFPREFFRVERRAGEDASVDVKGRNLAPAAVSVQDEFLRLRMGVDVDLLKRYVPDRGIGGLGGNRSTKR